MDIAALSTAMSMQSTGIQVGMAVTKLAMDTTDQTAQMMTDMMKSMSASVQPHLGANIDINI